ncbi:hypothetical protein ACFSQQ_16505 [Mesorhizobium kowhaii]|uniref:hypothetical protein n=1 Tax=Mesorhizobium kowhaii TaxID=1300272 RepID=UPI0035EAB21F
MSSNVVVASELNHVLVQLFAWRHVVRRWMWCIPSREFDVLMFVLDQTLWCGVYERVFTRRFLEHGDWDTGPEETRTHGLGIDQRHIRRAIVSLESKGFINVDRTDMSEGLLISLSLYTLFGGNPESMPTRVIEAYEFDARMSGVDPRSALPGQQRGNVPTAEPAQPQQAI